ncbi:polysaccharide polymerase [Actinomyces naeslundii]|uniref:Polysaccharide polymerase n=1 Tax=Actinomyces naeslundii TaxID=1655 RepID=A0ABX3F3D8_ACTNA|nr:EpsG family protein [Actinomyces naeslundii]OLO83456.1 polysaccharide polymerase [Actinomyces naeslundii]OLO90741.1 polysaccharide polymerase [Actinomyces naeslundii]OLO92431.1 polysaccharide polymerase [Actinomyces naeslundii]
MWIHFALFSTLLLPAALLGLRGRAGRRGSPVLLGVAFVAFVAFSSLRAVSVGNDTVEYHRVFKAIAATDSFQEALSVSRFESGYVLVNYLVSRLTQDFNLLLLITSVFVYGSAVLFIKRYAASYSLALLFAFGMSVFYDLMLAVRQGIAVAIFLLAVPALMERKLVRYVLLVVLASQFHVSVLLMLVVYLIPYMRLSTFGDWFKWGALIGIVMFSLSWLLTRLLVSSAYYGHYLHSDYADGGVRSATVLLIVTRIILMLLAATCGWNAAVEADPSGRTRNLLALAVADIAMVTVSLGFNLVDRLEMYLTLPFVVGLANIAVRGQRPERSYVSALLVVIAFAATTTFFLYRPDWFHLFPYHTFLEKGLP